MQWTTSYNENVLSFANNINTHEGGTHEEGFRTALTKALNDFGRSKNILKEKEANLSGEDSREGLTAVISVKVREPQFEGQTKTKLGNTEIRSYVQKALNRMLPEWLEKHSAESRRIIEKAVSAPEGPRGRPQGPRPHSPQVVTRIVVAARQAVRLFDEGPGAF